MHVVSDDRIEITVDEAGICTFAMHDRESKNAMSKGFASALYARLGEVAELPNVRVVVLRGLPEVFSSGATEETIAELVAGTISPEELLLPRKVLDIPVPVIAAMEGHTIGGGLGVALCADIIILARESRYGCSFMNMGFTPGVGLTRLLENVVSPAIAHEMLYTGAAFRGSHFEGRSGFNYILPRAEVLPKAHDLAARIAEKPIHALKTLKGVLSLPKRLAFEQARVSEVIMHQRTFAHPDTAELVRSYFNQFADTSGR